MGLRLAIGLCAPLAVFWGGVADPWFVPVYAVSAAAWLATLVGMRRALSVETASRLACAVLFGLCAAATRILGPEHPAAAAHFLVVPVATGFVCGRWEMWFSVASCSIATLAIDLADVAMGAPLLDLDGFSVSLIVVPCLVVMGVISGTWSAAHFRLEMELEREMIELEEHSEARRVLLQIAELTRFGESFESAARLVARLVETQPGVRSAAVCDLRRFGDSPHVLRTSGEEGALGENETASRLLVQGPEVEYIEDQNGCAVWIRSGDEIFGILEIEADAMSVRLRDLLTHAASHLANLAGNEAIEEALRRETLEDFVTGLLNRRAFEKRLSDSVQRAAECEVRAALLFIDLDGFKRINDSLGHSAGDQVLRAVARRIQKCIRLSDAFLAGGASPKHVARLGGDEFTVLLDDVARSEDVEIVAQRIIDAIEKPIEVSGRTVRLRTSIGIALYPDDARNALDLIRASDTAMYQAKRFEQSTYRRATAVAQGEAPPGFEYEIRSAIENRTMGFHLQPIFDARSGTIVAAELLARWLHPTRGWISPGVFIPFAERHGLMRELGRYFFDAGYRWFEESVGALPPDFRLALNVSPRQIEDSDFVSDVAGRFANGSLGVDRFEFEITETALMGDLAELGDYLKALNEMGVSFSLDDFGTGFSSLALIKKAPVNRIKIDRSFVKGLPDNPNDVAIVSGTLRMAHELGLSVVAEGVETEAQQEFLSSRGCDALQGYLLARPMEPGAFLDLVRSRAGEAADPEDRGSD